MMIPYRQIWKSESSGEDEFGMEIRVTVNRDLSELERQSLFDAARMLERAIRTENRRLDPKQAEARRMERLDILALFTGSIFVEEIPNGYCSEWCCSQKPWFVVTTTYGRIKIGWRKRVIEIYWGDSAITATAESLFPGEDVTKSERLIHAWGYDKARQYIRTLEQSSPAGERAATTKDSE